MAPETEVTQRAMKVLRQEGDYEGGKLLLLSQPDRVDWVWHATDNPELVQEVSTLGSFRETIPKFQSLLEKWLSASPSALRLALGAELVLPVDSVAGGYERLKHYLPGLRLNSVNSSDLIYRINRSRQSKAKPNLKLNRLSTWGVIQGTVLSFLVSGPAGLGPSLAVPPSLRPACRLELDINTAPESQVDLQSDDIRVLLQEFMELASEFTELGDVE
ncbi:MAG: hypothetical protein ACREQT_15160 [Candidatus Binataceae bacterium]